MSYDKRWRDVVDPKRVTGAGNTGTQLPEASMFVMRTLTLGDAFAARYSELRRLAMEEELGVAAASVNLATGALGARAWAARLESRVNVLSIGRHSHCDLLLDDHAMSLRHSVVLIGQTGKGVARFSLHDLESEPRLRDVKGRELRAAHAEGIAAFVLGEHALFVLATGTGDEWPDDAISAWRTVCELELDAEEGDRATANRVRRKQRELRASAVKVRDSRMRSSVIPSEGPRRSQVIDLASYKADEEVIGYRGDPDRGGSEMDAPIGSLSVESEGRRVRLLLSRQAAERGVLVGRSARCDGVLSANEISRVHMLVIAVDGELLAVDAGSVNGVYANGRLVRVASLSEHPEGVTLGSDLAKVTWLG